MSSIGKAQPPPPAIDYSTPLPVNLMSQNGWLEDTVGGIHGSSSTYPDCPGMYSGFGSNTIPCQVSTTYNVNKNNRWNDVKNSFAKFVRFGGTTADQNKPALWQYLKFVDSVRAKGMEPVLQIPMNYGYDGTPIYDTANAKTVITYINSTKARNVVYWIIGNEPDNTKPWGYNYNSNANHYADTISIYIKNFSKAMRRAVPSVAIKIIGPELAGWDSDPGYDMKKIVDSLVTPGQRCDITGKDPATGKWWIDYFSFHYYANGTNGDHAAVKRDSVIRNIGSKYGLDSTLAYLKRKVDYANGSSGNNRGTSLLKMAITEANIDVQDTTTHDTWTGVKSHSFIAGQFWMEMAGVSAKYGVDFLCYWSALENTLGYMKADGTKNSTYYHFQIMADNFRTCTNYKTGTTNNYYIKAFGAKGTSKSIVVITNQDTVTDAATGYILRLDDFTPTSPTWMRMDFGSVTNPQYTGSIDASATQVLVFDCAGNLSKKIDYKQSGGSGGTPSTTTYSSNPIIIANAGADKNTCCGGNSVQIGTASSGYPTGTTFAWTPCNSTLSSCTVAQPNASPASTTIYTLTTTLNGCTSTDDMKVTVGSTCCGGRMAQNVQNPEAKIGSELLDNVPNPSAGTTTIYYNLAPGALKGEIRIIDIYGKVIETIPVSTGSTSVEFNCTSCANGIYFYSLIVGEEIIGTKKMVIAK